jgi:hypothetical protein
MAPSYSKMISVATAGYAAYALVKPRHLGKMLTNSPLKQPEYDAVARLFGPRDFTIAALAILAPSAEAREHAMFARIAFDLSDAAILTPEARGKAAKAKVLAATLSWAGLTAAAVLADRRAN